MQDSRQGNLWVWVGIVVVIIAVVLFFVWKPSQSTAPVTTTTQNGGTGEATPGTPVYAPQGQAVSGFPQQLILGNNAKISSSYSVDYASSTDQYTAEFDSSSTVDAIFSEYQNTLPAWGWSITNQGESDSNAEVYAVSGSSVVSVAIYPQDNLTHVVVTYLAGSSE